MATALRAAGAFSRILSKVPRTADAASAPRQSNRYKATSGRGIWRSWNLNCVLIPKLPPAPPRQAQKRSVVLAVIDLAHPAIGGDDS